MPGIVACGEPRLRRVGSKLFADLVVRLSRTIAFSQAHALTEEAERVVRAVLSDTEIDLVLHMEPVRAPDEQIAETIRYRAREADLRVHDVRVIRSAGGGFEADTHVEADPGLTLERAHALATRLEATVRNDAPELRHLNTHLEVLSTVVERRVEVTVAESELVARVRSITERIAGAGASHEVRVYRPLGDGPGARTEVSVAYDLVLHVAAPGEAPMPAVHERSEEIERALRAGVPNLAHVLIHAEPPGA